MKNITYENKLTAIIKAQVKGGCDSYKWITESDRIYISPFGHSVYALGEGNFYPKGTANSTQFDILRILLDPESLKAAYGNAITKKQEEYIRGGTIFNIGVTSFWKIAAQEILGEWLSNGMEKAIDTALILLP